MGLSVGELFVNLGVKGTDKTVQAFTTVKAGMGEMASMSLEAKAAIIGALYALEQLTASSLKLGTNLTNTSAILGTTAKTLQEYDYAARQVGASNQEMEGTFYSLQSTMAKMRLGEGAPKWLGEIARVTGSNIDQSAVNRFIEHPEDFIQLLQSFAAKEKDVGLRNEALNALGIPKNIEAGLLKGVFNDKVFGRAPVVNDRQIASLDASRRALGNMAAEWEKLFAVLTAEHGQQLVKNLAQISIALLNLANAADKISNKLNLFDKLTTLVNFLTLTPDKDSPLHKPYNPLDPKMNPNIGNQPNFHQEIHVHGTQANPSDIGRAAEHGAKKVFNKKVDSAGRQNLGQGQVPR